MLMKEWFYKITEVYGDREYTNTIYAWTREHVYGIAMKDAEELGFDFPLISIEQIGQFNLH